MCSKQFVQQKKCLRGSSSELYISIGAKFKEPGLQTKPYLFRVHLYTRRGLNSELWVPENPTFARALLFGQRS